MALNDTFTIQEINLDKKNLSFDNKLKEIEAYWNNECAEHPSNNHCKNFLWLKLKFLGILTLDFYIIPVLKNNQIERRPNKWLI